VHIIDVEPGKIWLACDRSNGSEIIGFKVNPISPARWIGKSFKARHGWRGWQFRFASAEQSQPLRFGCRLFHYLNVQWSTLNVQFSMAASDNPPTSKPRDRAGVIDVIAEDTKTGEVVLVMNELDEWEGSDEQLLALQERFNAYVSFLLDGEMASDQPELAGKPARIELRCAHVPDTRALELLGLIHDQLAFQEIKLEVVVGNDPPSPKATA